MASRFSDSRTRSDPEAGLRSRLSTMRNRLISVTITGVLLAHGALALGVYQMQENSHERREPQLDKAPVEYAALTDQMILDARFQSQRMPERLPAGSFQRVEADRPELDAIAAPVPSFARLEFPAATVDPLTAMVGSHIVLLLLIGLMFAYVIRTTIRPLSQITSAVSALGPERLGQELEENGPPEVAAMARAFNTMRRRMRGHMDERIQMLSAFSHDMQTPITRMRLRAELANTFPDREKFLRDLDETERLIREGMAYARNAHVRQEEIKSVDLHAFIDCLVMDYQETDRAVSVIGNVGGVIMTRPQALRRALTNFVDNALKFSGAAEVRVVHKDNGKIVISVLDRGPGIAEELLERVKKPFVRGAQSATGQVQGTGLGLAIAQQLAASLDASFNLRQRAGGGLIAELILSTTVLQASDTPRLEAALALA